jgi:hypothetical protein
MSCLDDLALEKALLSEPDAAQATHLEACASCAHRLSVMRSQGEDFRRFVFPHTVDAVVSSTRPKRWWPLVLPVAVALGLAVWVAVPRGPPADYVGLKGQSVGLAVFSVDDAGAAVRLQDGSHIRADASLRFQAKPDAPCYLWLVTLDDRNHVSRLYPVDGPPPLVEGATTLPGGAMLDGVVGPERVFAVCSHKPLPFDVITSAARGLSADAVRRLHRLELDGAQGTLLLEKTP